MRFGLMAAAAACVVAAPASAATQVVSGAIGAGQSLTETLDGSAVMTGRFILRVAATSALSVSFFVPYTETEYVFYPDGRIEFDNQIDSSASGSAPSTSRFEYVFKPANKINRGGGVYETNAYAFGPFAVTLNSPADADYRITLLSIPGQVPEPATWALMILGFGAVAAAVRRRAKHTYQPA